MHQLVSLITSALLLTGCSTQFSAEAQLSPTNDKEPHSVPQQTETLSAYDLKLEKVKDKLPPGFTIVRASPFLVMGDEAPEVVEQRAQRTVQWATRMLKKDYFSKDPDAVVTIWLFKDAASYQKHTWSLFRDKPGTPYGYYSPSHEALIMNIATGGGTLVHEMVHPFMSANFPACPSWLNEGLASLYEQCGEKDGKIYGHTNWRLAGLQEAIEEGSLPTFEALMSTTEDEFYYDDPGTNYAQARYLCYYLQEKGKLRQFYRAFTANADTDPTGYKTLQEVLGTTDMDAFQADWERWIQTLRYP